MFIIEITLTVEYKSIMLRIVSSTQKGHNQFRGKPSRFLVATLRPYMVYDS